MHRLVVVVLVSLVLNACAGGGNDSPPAQTPTQTNAPAPAQSNTPAQTPAQTPTPPQAAQTPTPTPSPSPTPQTPPVVADLHGYASITDITLSGISAMLTAPQPAIGGQEEVLAVDDTTGNLNGHDEHAAVNVTWRDIDLTAHVPQTGTATYHIDASGVQLSSLFTGHGVINTEGGRFGNILAGESGDLTITAHYTLIAPPGASSNGTVNMGLGNVTTNDFKRTNVELPTTNPEGTLSLTIFFKAGDTGSLQYLANLHSEAESP